jgi:hypothetical protein
MTTQVRLWHSWRAQLRQLLAGIRATRVDGLAILALGMVWSGSVALPQIAASLPFEVDDLSTERRLRRWLSNDHVEVRSLWAALLPALVRRFPHPRPLFVFDPTPHVDAFTVLALGLVVHRRVMPVAWRLVPQQSTWPKPMEVLLRELLVELQTALPPTCEPTLLVDRGITSAAMIDLCRELGWHYVFRVNTGPEQANRVRLASGEERHLWSLVTRAGQRWTGTVEVFKGAGWRRVHLTIHWDLAAAEPWILLSDRPAGGARVHEYRCRARCEATYLDCKTRGWDVETTKLTVEARLERLLLGLHVAFWWAHQLGLHAIRTGRRHCYDRRDRRDLSVVKLGFRLFADCMAHQRLPPLLFAFRNNEWRLRAFP